MRIPSFILLTLFALAGFATCDKEDDEVLTEIDHRGIPMSEFQMKAKEYEAYEKMLAEEERLTARHGRSAEVFDEKEYEDCDEDELNYHGEDSEGSEDSQKDDSEGEDEEDADEEEADDGDGDEEEEEDEEDVIDEPYTFSFEDRDYLNQN